MKIILSYAALALPMITFAADQPPKLRLGEVENIEPVDYTADLTIDPQKDDFTGSITMSLDIRQPVQTIWLNQEKITIKTASLTYRGKSISAKTVPGGADFVGFQFESPIRVGKVTLTATYSGVVNTESFAAVFRRKDGDNSYIFTQFEATDARGAFPCFDEPSYKTPWQLTLHIPSSDTAISNTGVSSETTNGAMKTVVFRQTKPLPSYLVAFGVGPLEFVDAGKAGSRQVPVRIVVPRGHKAEAKYAAQVSAEIISRHEKYFGVPYPYDKADQVAVPEMPGAMENPGMVTYGQTLILSKPETDSINRQREYSIVAAHELAHQWFGDLVTTAWWDDIWLNEAFATWMEKKYIADWEPAWKTRVGDVNDKLGAEDQDSLISARKVRQPIESNNDINNAFDGITYQKGGAVIGMFENWMGPAAFQKGVQSYMKLYAFKATTSGEFLDSLESASNKDKDVAKSFPTFLNQAGVPIVSVALKCDGNLSTLHMEQQRFLPLGSKGSSDQVWQIPMCVRYGVGDAGQTECTLMTQAAMDWKLKASYCPAWVQANDQAIGFYRVDYQGGLLSALANGSVETRLSAPERVDLMGNAEALSSAGKLPAASALALVSTFHADSERQVLRRAIELAIAPQQELVPDELLPNYRRFLLQNFQARAHELGWIPKPGESDDTRLLRPSIVRTVATWGGDRQFAQQAIELTHKWLADQAGIDPNMINAVLGTAAFYGDKALFDRFLALFKSSQDKQLRERIIGAMGSFQDRASMGSRNERSAGW